MISTACCLVHPNFKVRSIILLILRDEIISWYKRVKFNEKVAMFSTMKLNDLANSSQNQATNSNEDGNTDETSSEIEAQQKKNKFAVLLSQKYNLQSTEVPEIKNEDLVNLGTKAVNSIMSRLQSMF